MEEFDQKKKKAEADRLSIAGTRATHAVDEDTPFHKQFVKMLLQAGILLNKADLMHDWLESKCGSSLTAIPGDIDWRLLLCP